MLDNSLALIGGPGDAVLLVEQYMKKIQVKKEKPKMASGPSGRL